MVKGKRKSSSKPELQSDGRPSKSKYDPPKSQSNSSPPKSKYEKAEELDNSNEIDSTDYFSAHFDYNLPEGIAESLGEGRPLGVENVATKNFGTIQFTKNCEISQKPKISSEKNFNKIFNEMKVKKSILKNLKEANPKKCETEIPLTSTQMELFQFLNSYCDFFVPKIHLNQKEEIQFVYAVHALNHALKNRSKILQHNAKIKHSDLAEGRQGQGRTRSKVLNAKIKDQDPNEGQRDPAEDHRDPTEFRDQGLTRPKILILVPFRESARRIVEIWIQLLFSGDREFVTNKKRFFDEFSSDENPKDSDKSKNSGNSEDAPKTFKKKPKDFEELFKGNTDDCFRVGIGVAKKSLKLFVEFYAADILLASPLGLR